MKRDDKVFIKNLQNTSANLNNKIKFRQIDNNWWYFVLNKDGKQEFRIKRTCNISSGHPVFAYIVKTKTKGTTDNDIGKVIFASLESEYHKRFIQKHK